MVSYIVDDHFHDLKHEETNHFVIYAQAVGASVWSFAWNTLAPLASTHTQP